MNKKLMIFGIIGLFAMALVSAGLLIHYGQVQQDFNITSPITVDGITTTSIDDYAGTSYNGDAITIKNLADFEVEVKISNDAGLPKNKGIDVSYVGELILIEKSLTDWTPNSDNQKTITYTVVGDTFEFSEVPGYTLVYYPNTETYEHYDGVVVLAENVNSMNLPDSNDLNGREDSDYCTNGKNYLVGEGQCIGAKLWLVPEEVVTENVIDWNQASKFYFETELIQYNALGEITLSPRASLTITPVYTIASNYISEGIVTITTSVNPIVA